MHNPDVNISQPMNDPEMSNIDTITQEIVEDAFHTIDTATADQVAGLLSGSQCLFLTQDHETWILAIDAEDDSAYRQTFGRLYDLAVNGMDSYGDDYEVLAAAVEIVGMPDDYDDLDELEEAGIADEIRAEALTVSPKFMQNCRDNLKRFINTEHIRQMVEESLDDQEQNLSACYS